MPWFPDFANAVELVRKQTRAAGRADPVAEYFAALNTRDEHVLETVWPGDVTVYDPKAGVVHGHRQLHQFVRQYQSWLGERKASTETIASIVVGDRAVVELVAHLGGADGDAHPWPIAVVAETPDDRSVVFRTYCRVWPLTGPHRVRPPVLPAADSHPADVVGRYQAALQAGDTDAVVATFEPDGYFREPAGPRPTAAPPSSARSSPGG